MLSRLQGPLLAAVLVLAAATRPSIAMAEDVPHLSLHANAGTWRPTAAFVQYGAAEDARMLVIGLTWDWAWRRELLGGALGGYWEASFGRWNADNAPGAHGWFTQVGVTPVVRYAFGDERRWFAEAGIGANLLLPVYQTDDKRFSTTFNFGDHIAFGRRFGDLGKHIVSLRFQHFSNASIRKPNPGENFVQLRYVRQF